MSEANKSQVGGTHYKDLPLEPWKIIELLRLDFWHANPLKYLLRWQRKGGVQDLRKLRHCVDKLIELAESGYYGEQFKVSPTPSVTVVSEKGFTNISE